MTALLQRRTRAVTAPVPETVNRVLLHGIDWQTYQTIADALPERKIRITYDRGDMEMMTVSLIHERYKSLLPFLLLAIAEVLRRKINCFGSFTHRRKDLLRAIEPDLCYYIKHFSDVRGLRQIDLERDPPPDLAIEVEISRSMLDRMGILAALRVPELWRFEGEVIKVYLLKEGTYVSSERSLAFPEVPVGELVRFLQLGLDQGEQAMMAAARKWAGGLKKARKTK